MTLICSNTCWGKERAYAITTSLIAIAYQCLPLNQEAFSGLSSTVKNDSIANRMETQNKIEFKSTGSQICLCAYFLLYSIKFYPKSLKPGWFLFSTSVNLSPFFHSKKRLPLILLKCILCTFQAGLLAVRLICTLVPEVTLAFYKEALSLLVIWIYQELCKLTYLM